MRLRHEPEKPSSPWIVDLSKADTKTRRTRKCFGTKDDAEAYMVRVRMNGFEGADTRKDALKTGTISLGECTAMWRSRNEKIGKGAQNQIKAVTASLDAKFKRWAISEITHRELDAWMRANPHGYITKLNYHRLARRFFAYAVDWLEVIPRNPMVKVPKPTGERNEVQILTPSIMAALLEKVENFKHPLNLRMIAYLCLGGFAGIRVEEILKMDWKDVNWSGGEIYVRQPKRVKGWKPRYVDILPPLRRHVEAIAPKEGKVFPGGQRSLYLARKELCNLMGWPGWPDNCLRHSFKTYHAAHFQDIEKTKIQMGHSDDDMTKYQYGAPEARAVASQWWEV